MSVVFSSEHFTVDIERATQLARITRTTTPFASPEELAEKWLETSRAIDRFDPGRRHGRSKLSLLVDLRAAPGRNDPAFEEAMLRIRPVVMFGFRRLGILIKTPAGALQIQRHVREDGIERRIGSDEAALVTYLTGTGE